MPQSPVLAARKRRYHTISYQVARELIWSQRVNGNGELFGVAFERAHRSKDKKREPGQLEVMFVRFNVKKHCKTIGQGWVHPDGFVRKHWVEGAKPFGAAYDRFDKDCFCVFCFNRREKAGRVEPLGFKSIKFESLVWLKIDGIVFKVGDPPPPQH